MHKYRLFLAGLSLFAGVVYLANASRFTDAGAGEMTLLSHQIFRKTGLDKGSCTATRINPPTHGFLENTLPSMQAAIAAGANIIEIDIHPTTEGEFVVFHDWTLDCRTNGQGKTRDHSLAQLKALDIGYGYTADDGLTFPFRGRFVGAMPSLDEVLDAFPNQTLDVNIKSRSKKEARLLIDYLDRRGGQDWERVSFNGHDAPISALLQAHPQLLTYGKQRTKTCFKGYMLTGWFDRMPHACRNIILPVPSNYRHFIWGWPHRFEGRLNRVGSRSMLMGPYHGQGTNGIDTEEDIALVPKGYTGIVRTDKIEVIGLKLANEIAPR